jgi:hypothetical protein
MQKKAFHPKTLLYTIPPPPTPTHTHTHNPPHTHTHTTTTTTHTHTHTHLRLQVRVVRYTADRRLQLLLVHTEDVLPAGPA